MLSVMETLDAISPIDGRYRGQVEPLAEFFSERALIKYRTMVECAYLIALSETSGTGLRRFTEEEKLRIRSVGAISAADAAIVKDIEVGGHDGMRPTNHDLKAIEYYIKEKLGGTSLSDSLEWVHFALTSDDTKNIAHSMMMSDSLEKVLIPAAKALYERLDELALLYRNVAILARTHGQPASPTTFGKEFRVFASRVKRQVDQLESTELLVKLNGATGNYNAHQAACPDVDWVAFTRQFVETLNSGRRVRLAPNLVTTQIEPHDSYAELFDNIHRLNTVVIGLAQDAWRYISDDWLVQKPVAGEVGSSTMPHKVNPIDFENCEGNLGIANALLHHFSSKLPISRLQRDLSDATVLRNIGVALGHCVIAYNSAVKGLGKVSVNEAKVAEALRNHPEVVSEAIQTILRREGVEMPYEKLREVTRGKRVTMQDLSRFVDGLQVSEELKARLKRLTPESYIGLASTLAGN
ncbi:adenylosuccinate lyase [Candidatus Micrarchaeota archaeon]|nr:adenylosuccinate lyase [Candidatus Micrarchaeota archaeon]